MDSHYEKKFYIWGILLLTILFWIRLLVHPSQYNHSGTTVIIFTYPILILGLYVATACITFLLAIPLFFLNLILYGIIGEGYHINSHWSPLDKKMNNERSQKDIGEKAIYYSCIAEIFLIGILNAIGEIVNMSSELHGSIEPFLWRILFNT